MRRREDFAEMSFKRNVLLAGTRQFSSALDAPKMSWDPWLISAVQSVTRVGVAGQKFTTLEDPCTMIGLGFPKKGQLSHLNNQNEKSRELNAIA